MPPFRSTSISGKSNLFFDELIAADTVCGPGTRKMFSTFSMSNAGKHNWLEKTWAMVCSGYFNLVFTSNSADPTPPPLVVPFDIADWDLSKVKVSEHPNFTFGTSSVSADSVGLAMPLGSVVFDDGNEPAYAITFEGYIMVTWTAPEYLYWIRNALVAINETVLPGVTFWTDFAVRFHARITWSFVSPISGELVIGDSDLGQLGWGIGDQAGWHMNPPTDWTTEWLEPVGDGSYASAPFLNEVACESPESSSPFRGLEDQTDFAIRLRDVGASDPNALMLDSITIGGREHYSPRPEP
ncbi:MAG: hypothetical protein V4710_18970 [Verrucomicrobiota bacterium]